jgi:ribosome maturation factor RimP
MASIEERVESLVKKKIEDIGYELYDVLYLKEGKNYTLRIVIDKQDGIDLNDCEKVNNEITDLLDEADYIKDQYFLEVSSPGLERVLRKDWQLKKYIGAEVEIKLFKKDENGFKEYLGILEEVEEEYLTIKDEENREYKIERKAISQAKTVYKDF